MSRLRYYGVPWTFVEPTALSASKMQLSACVSAPPEPYFELDSSTFPPDDIAVIQNCTKPVTRSRDLPSFGLSRMDLAKSEQRERSRQQARRNAAPVAAKISNLSTADEIEQEPLLSSREPPASPRYDFGRVAGERSGHLGNTTSAEDVEMVTDGQLRAFVRRTMKVREKQKPAGAGMRVVPYCVAAPKRYARYLCPTKTTDMSMVGKDPRTECDQTYIGQRFKAYLASIDKPRYQPRQRFARR
jgi:hypothetical protein